MKGDAFSRNAIKRSLLHFAIGKAGAAVVGFALLLLLVRALSKEQYGIYVALVALFEIVQLGSNFGIFSGAYRFVPQLLASGNGLQLRRLVFWLTGLRVLTLIVPALCLWALSVPISIILGIQDFTYVLKCYGLVLVAEGTARYVDLLFDALLEQGRVQLAIISRNALRVVGALVLIQIGTQHLTLMYWVYIEFAASSLGLALSGWMLKNTLNKHAIENPGESGELDIKRIARFAAYQYLSQLGYLLQSADVVRLLVTKTAGAVTAGAFGFAGAIGGMLRRYLPSFLLIGMIRSLFVSQREKHGNSDRLGKLADMVVRLNLFLLLPAMACVIVVGQPILNLLSGGKFPDAAPFMLLFVALVALQSLHAVLEMLANAIESTKAPVRSTFLAAAVLLLFVLASTEYGILALCVGMLCSEVAFAAAMIYALQQEGVRYEASTTSLLKLLALSFISILFGLSALAVCNFFGILGGTWAVILVCAAICTAFYGLAIRFKPFLTEERALINSLLPRKVFVW